MAKDKSKGHHGVEETPEVETPKVEETPEVAEEAEEVSDIVEEVATPEEPAKVWTPEEIAAAAAVHKVSTR